MDSKTLRVSGGGVSLENTVAKVKKKNVVIIIRHAKDSKGRCLKYHS